MDDTSNEGITASDTWTSLVVAIVLTSIQVAVLLVCFEAARRSPNFASVYDRRRLKYPTRTPPPLRKRWHPFTWWTLKVGNEEYNETSRKEAAAEKQKRVAEKEKQGSKHDQEILLKAEEYCRMSVPFFRDLEVEEDDEEKQTISGGEATVATVQSISQTETSVEISVEVSQDFSVLDSFRESKNAINVHDLGEDDGDDEEVWDALDEFVPSPLSVSVQSKAASEKQSDVLKDQAEAASDPEIMSNEFVVMNGSQQNAMVSAQESSTLTPSLPPRPSYSRPRSTSLPADANDLARMTESSSLSLPNFPPCPKYNRPRSTLLPTSEHEIAPTTEASSASSPSFPSRPSYNRRRSTSLPVIVEPSPPHNKRASSPGIFKRKSLSEHGQPTGTVPLVIGGSDGSNSRRRVRFDDVWARDESMGSSRRLIRTDSTMTVGSRESQRLAKLRFEQDAVRSNWDKKAVRKASKFVRNRILMLRDDNEGDEEQQGPSIQDQQKKFISRQVERRPLTLEDQELLRIVGLDAFMILRFLRFATDVFFWPFLLASVTLLPLYLTADNGAIGFFETTAIAIISSPGKYWMVVIFEYVHFCYILRRLWIEWELFLPLRYDFLEHGDFEKEKYKDQYRMTCIVEYVPPSHRHDKNLFHFFDTLFPGQVKRAEVLLNTEHLRQLIRARLLHIMAYENIFAKMVHARAVYLRELEIYEQHPTLKRCCRGVVTKPKVPTEPKKVVIRKIDRADMGNVLLNPQTLKVRDPRTWFAREWHHSNIQRLNKMIDDEYIRLAQEQRRPQPKRKENRLEKWLGIKYITGSDTTRNLHSSTGFVEFSSIEAKQAAVQCNLTGVNNLMSVSAVPEVKDIEWENAHVSRALIDTRKAWADALLVGGLIGWSFLVTLIRSYTGFADWLKWEALHSPTVAAFMEVYLPALIVEGLVRGIPFILNFICQFIRFKSASEKDTYILLWYFGFRLVTFIFILVGGSLVDSGFDFIEDPVGFLERLADNVALESQFFISYVLITGGMSTAFFMSQMHNVVKQWFIHKIITEEALPQRTLDDINSSVKQLHKFELLPIALFIFIVGVLYGAIAPLASVFVTVYFRVTYKAFKYMMLFYYGKFYENGGQLFYHLSTIVFFILYLVVLIVIGYVSHHGTGSMAGVLSVMLLIILVAQLHVHRTFVVPSRTLSLAKARLMDDAKYARNRKQYKLDAYRRAIAELQEEDDDENEDGVGRHSDHRLMRSLLEDHAADDMDDEVTPDESDSDSLYHESRRELADKRMQQRYQESVSDVTDEYEGNDFFIYRQPSLNRVTWEVSPRPYRKRLDRDYDCEIWR